jgi:hypothetical protein
MLSLLSQPGFSLWLNLKLMSLTILPPSVVSPGVNKSPFSALHHYLSLSLPFWGMWLDLKCCNFPGVGPLSGLGFQLQKEWYKKAATKGGSLTN